MCHLQKEKQTHKTNNVWNLARRQTPAIPGWSHNRQIIGFCKSLAFAKVLQKRFLPKYTIGTRTCRCIFLPILGVEGKFFTSEGYRSWHSTWRARHAVSAICPSNVQTFATSMISAYNDDRGRNRLTNRGRSHGTYITTHRRLRLSNTTRLTT